MPWPLSQDYNEAIQDMASSFSDADLKQGEAATNALGIPMPRSGNFADVYEVTTPKGKWAVKCFTRQIPGLRERYKEVSAYLKQTPLPFMVDFSYLEQGIRVRGEWYPVLKMQWVEGFNLNQFAKDNAEKPAILDVLCQLWVKLAAKLADAEMAHCDLQHGNVLLVPGSKAGSVAIKLVDYDGMCVPALTMLKTIEVGHPNFQHPQRAKDGIYSLEVDRFSHLVIVTATRALMTGGKALWDKYDNGDNLLFKASDFEKPGQSLLFKELLAFPEPGVRMLAQTMVQSLAKPLEQTPLLQELAPKLPAMKNAGKPTSPARPATGLKQAQNAEELFAGATSGGGQQRRAKKGNGVLIGLALGAVALLGVGGLVAAFMILGGGKDKNPEPEPKIAQHQPPDEPKKKETPKVEPKKKEMPETKNDPSTKDKLSKEPATKEDPLKEPVAKAEPVPRPAIPIPRPIAQWTFEKGARDSIGKLHGKLVGEAVVTRGRLRLTGQKAGMEAAPLPADLKEKTFELWLFLPDLDRPSFTMGITNEKTEAWDGIIYGAIQSADRPGQPRKWQIRSSYNQRNGDLNGPLESAKPNEPVHVVVTYASDNSITLYRNGKVYGAPIVPRGPNAELQTYSKTASRVLFGAAMWSDKIPSVEIAEARLYDRALTAREVAASFEQGCEGVQRTPADPPVAETTLELKPARDLLPAVDLSRHVIKGGVISGSWKRTTLGLQATTTGDEGGALVQVPLAGDAGSYELEADFTRTRSGEGFPCITAILPMGAARCQFWMDYRKEVGGLSTKGNPDPQSAQAGSPENGVKHTLKIRVALGKDKETAEIRATLDDKPYLRWQGKAADLDFSPNWPPPASCRLAIGCGQNTTITFHRVLWRDATPKAEPDKLVGLKAIEKQLIGRWTLQAGSYRTVWTFTPDGVMTNSENQKAKWEIQLREEGSRVWIVWAGNPQHWEYLLLPLDKGKTTGKTFFNKDWITEATKLPDAERPPAKPEVLTPNSGRNGRAPRLKLPNEGAQAKALKNVKSLFKEEYARTKATDMVALAKKLHSQGMESKDDQDIQFALFQESARIAAHAGDIGTAANAINELAARFEVNDIKLKVEALETAAVSSTFFATSKSLIDVALDTEQEALKADDFESASRLLAIVGKLAGKAKKASLVESVMSRMKALEELKTQHNALVETRQTLEAKPEDPDASLKMGKYLCLVRGNWYEGLPFLAKGSDEAMKTLAAQELAPPATPEKQCSLADGWWEAGDSEPPATKLAMQRHGYRWYEIAQPGLTGTTRTKAEKRIAEFEKLNSVKLLARINVKRHAVSGKWQYDGKKLATENVAFGRLQIPYVPADEYVIKLKVERAAGNAGTFAVGLAVPGAQSTMGFDIWNDPAGRQANESFITGIAGVTRRGKLLQLNQPADIACIVLKGHITAIANGQRIVEWRGDSKGLSLEAPWAVPNKRALFLANWMDVFSISSIDYTPISGQGWPLE